MRRYIASVQWGILDSDPVAGVNPRVEERPLARYYGTATISDSHTVNKLTLKHLRMSLPPDHLLLSSFCGQHHTGNGASELATSLEICTQTWCLAKTFAEGDFHRDLEIKVDAALEDEVEGLEIVDPRDFQLEPTDLTQEFTQCIMNRCYRHGLGAGEDTVGNSSDWEQVRDEFCAFFSYQTSRSPSVCRIDLLRLS